MPSTCTALTVLISLYILIYEYRNKQSNLYSCLFPDKSETSNLQNTDALFGADTIMLQVNLRRALCIYMCLFWSYLY